MSGKANPNQHVVVLGGGFGGLAAAKRLSRSPVDVTVVDRRNHHLFQPLLYQVAIGALNPADIAAPIRQILRRQKNARVLMGDAEKIDTVSKRVHLSDGGALEYDYLIVATGAAHAYFGNDSWAGLAPGLKSWGPRPALRRQGHRWQAASLGRAHRRHRRRDHRPRFTEPGGHLPADDAHAPARLRRYPRRANAPVSRRS